MSPEGFLGISWTSHSLDIYTLSRLVLDTEDSEHEGSLLAVEQKDHK